MDRKVIAMEYMKKLSLFVLLLIFLAGCATGALMSRIHPGMTKDDVTNILGKPDEYESQGGYEALKFTNRLVSGWLWNRADYNVIFRDSRVVEYGPGKVRKDFDANILFIVPLE
jgi:hypothetical protein